MGDISRRKLSYLYFSYYGFYSEVSHIFISLVASESTRRSTSIGLHDSSRDFIKTWWLWPIPNLHKPICHKTSISPTSSYIIRGRSFRNCVPCAKRHKGSYCLFIGCPYIFGHLWFYVPLSMRLRRRHCNYIGTRSMFIGHICRCKYYV